MNCCTTITHYWPTDSRSGPVRRSRLGGRHRTTLLRVGFALACCAVLTAARAGDPGEVLYQQGLLPSGEPIRAVREGNAAMEGADAACVNCHRRSGLGSGEGLITIPPIAGPYLFAPRTKSLEELGIPFVEGVRLNREAYTDASLARVIRDGIDSDGKTLNYLMPRYRLDDDAMAALIGYLKDMSHGPVPGVTPSVLHFATIITPDADPRKRSGVLDVLNKYFADKNAAVRSTAPTLYSSHRMFFRVARRWELHVWELTGASSTWRAQLRKHLAAEPVFAVISGLGGREWEPVHDFCEEERLPCLFPNVSAPVARADDFYSLYFSRGVLLEAEMIGRELRDGKAGNVARPQRIVQVFRSDDVGEQGSSALGKALGPTDYRLVNRALKSGASDKDLAASLKDLGPGDVLVLWLRGPDLLSLEKLRPPAGITAFASGEMADFESAPVPAGWRPVTRLTYPVDLPERRVVRVDYALGWFRIRQIPVVAQQVQADTYLACGILSETLNHMVDAFVRDYLLERMEMDLDHRVLTGYYPRLTLAPQQRFASKGGYIVRFTEPQGSKVAPLSDWMTP